MQSFDFEVEDLIRGCPFIMSTISRGEGSERKTVQMFDKGGVVKNRLKMFDVVNGRPLRLIWLLDRAFHVHLWAYYIIRHTEEPKPMRNGRVFVKRRKG